MFAATGVTNGDFLRGVRFSGGGARDPLGGDALQERDGALHRGASHRFDTTPGYGTRRAVRSEPPSGAAPRRRAAWPARPEADRHRRPGGAVLRPRDRLRALPGVRARASTRAACGSGSAGKEVEYELDVGVKRIRYVLRARGGAAAPRRLVARLGRHDEGLERLVGARGRGRQDARRSTRSRSRSASRRSCPRRSSTASRDELTRVQLPRTLEAFKRARGGGSVSA